MSSIPAHILEQTEPADAIPAFWLPDPHADIPTNCDEFDDAIPFRVAVLVLERGTPKVVAAVKSKRACVHLINDLTRIHRRKHYRARLKMCPVCANYGGATGIYYCDCPAGDMLRQQDALIDREIHEPDPADLAPAPAFAEEPAEMYGL